MEASAKVDRALCVDAAPRLPSAAAVGNRQKVAAQLDNEGL